MPMFTASLFTIAKRWKQHKCPPTGEWITKHTRGYYSATKRNEVSAHTTVWINLENSMPSKISQTQKVTCNMIPFIEISKTGKSIKIAD